MKAHHHEKLPLLSSRSSSPKLKVSCLTLKVTRDHLMEIFSGFGNVISIEMISSATDRVASSHSHDNALLHSAYIDYETKSEAAKAVKSMNGGMIDLHEILVELVSRKPHENHKTRKPKK